MVELKKPGNSNCGGGCGGTGALTHGRWEWKIVSLPRKTVWRFLKKLNIESPDGLARPLLGMCPRNQDICPQKDLHANIHSTLFTIAQTKKQPR